MRNEIEKAIRETLVISNKQSIHIAVDKVQKILLEALEREFSKVDISMFDEDRSSDYLEQGKFYYETEVKPKYK